MTDRERLIELLYGKSIDTMIDCEYVADCLFENGVVVPPCKVGDTVYCIFRNRETLEWYIGEKTVYEIAMYENGMHIYISPIISYCKMDIGVSIFLTREEAEKALAERREQK